MDTPALRRLMSNYLHQDYDLLGTVDDNIDAFVDDEPGLATHLPTEVDAILGQDLSEEELSRLVESLGGELRPIPPMTHRQWFAQIADRVRAAT